MYFVLKVAIKILFFLQNLPFAIIQNAFMALLAMNSDRIHLMLSMISAGTSLQRTYLLVSPFSASTTSVMVVS